MDERDVDRLLQDASIIRNRAKIEATIGNAAAIVDLHSRGRSLASILWGSVRPETPPAEALEGLPSVTAEAKALSKLLKKEGFRFIGPTTAYAAMQALGVVNDHLATCHVRDGVEEERTRFLERLRSGGPL